MVIRASVTVAAFLATAASAGTVEHEFGTLNPQDSGFGRIMRNIDNGITDMTTCAAGYYITKSGRHALARRLFEACATSGGYPGSMTWMSQLDNNGLAGPYNPDAATDWDRRAAETGDPVGRFNYGLDLIRGHGVEQDRARGRGLVDSAAAEGLAIARRMQASGYDPDEVTPDADNWKFAPMF